MYYCAKGGNTMDRNLKAYHEKNRYYEIFASNELQGKFEHIKSVIKLAKVIAELNNSNVDLELLCVLAEHHDDGRVNQQNILGKFCDSKITHNVLGIDRVNRFIVENNLEVDEEIQLLRNVIMYHGRQHLAPQLSSKEKLYVDLVTEADDFENSMSCVSYLIKEVENDAKGYIEDDPEANQKQITEEYSDYIWKCFKEGKKFDKKKYCKTYADYVLFVATLVTNSIVKYPSIAKTAFTQPGYGYNTILDGFKVTFDATLISEDANKAYKILKDMLK